MRQQVSQTPKRILKEASTALVDLKLVCAQRGDEIDRRNCPDGQFYMVTQGLWRFEEEGTATRVGTMDFSYSAPGQPCRRTAEQTVVAFGIQVRGKALSCKFQKPLDHRFLNWDLKRSYMRSLRAFVLNQDSADIEDEVILALQAPEESKQERIPKWLLMARDLVHENRAEAQSLSAIAEQIGITPTHLSTSFRSAFGIPFATYRRRVRIERTLDSAMRHSQELNVAAIAAGFYDASHFHRACRIELGMEPATLQRVIQGTKIESLYKTPA